MTTYQLIAELQKYDGNQEVLCLDLWTGNVSDLIYLSMGQNTRNNHPCIYLVQDVIRRNALRVESPPMALADEAEE